jgi:hypothetical protein
MNITKATYWYETAAKQGDVDLIYSVAAFYKEQTKELHGLEDELLRHYLASSNPNPEKCAYWSKIAAEKGHKWAQQNIGVFYLLGEGVSKDYSEAAYWFMRASEQGVEKSQIAYEALVRLGVKPAITQKQQTTSKELSNDSGPHLRGWDSL